MTHYIKNNQGTEFSFSAGCNHPKNENNQCPTRYGDCATCKHCIVIIDNGQVENFLKYLREV